MSFSNNLNRAELRGINNHTLLAKSVRPCLSTHHWSWLWAQRSFRVQHHRVFQVIFMKCMSQKTQESHNWPLAMFPNSAMDTHTHIPEQQGDTKRDRKSSKGQWVRNVMSSTCSPSRCFSLCCAQSLSSLWRHIESSCTMPPLLAYSIFLPSSPFLCAWKRERAPPHVPLSILSPLDVYNGCSGKDKPFTSCTSPGLIKSHKL